MPARSAMPATVRLALAPISVPLPPRQAPSDSDHQSGSSPSGPPKVGAMLLITGIIVATKGILSMIADRMRRGPQDGDRRVARSPPVSVRTSSREPIQQARMLDAGDDDEQADEEEDRDPFDFREHLVQPVGLRLPLPRQQSSSRSNAAPASAMVPASSPMNRAVTKPRHHETDHERICRAASSR